MKIISRKSRVLFALTMSTLFIKSFPARLPLEVTANIQAYSQFCIRALQQTILPTNNETDLIFRIQANNLITAGKDKFIDKLKKKLKNYNLYKDEYLEKMTDIESKYLNCDTTSIQVIEDMINQRKNERLFELRGKLENAITKGSLVLYSRFNKTTNEYNTQLGHIIDAKSIKRILEEHRYGFNYFVKNANPSIPQDKYLEYAKSFEEEMLWIAQDILTEVNQSDAEIIGQWINDYFTALEIKAVATIEQKEPALPDVNTSIFFDTRQDYEEDYS